MAAAATGADPAGKAMSQPKRTISDLFLRRPVLSLVLTALLLLMGA